MRVARHSAITAAPSRATRKAELLLSQAKARLALTARAYHRVQKVARTIADLAGSETVEASHMSESIAYPRSEAPSDGRLRAGIAAP